MADLTLNARLVWNDLKAFEIFHFWNVNARMVMKRGGGERKKKEIFPKYVLFWSSLSWWDNYLNPDSNIYFAVPHFGRFQVSPLHSPYVHWVVYRFRCSALFGGAQNGGLFIRAAAIPVVNVCCYIFRLSAVTTAPISAILVVLFSLSF